MFFRHNKSKNLLWRTIIITSCLALSLSACTSFDSATNNTKTKTQKVKFILDWTPNTNHTGIYVAKAKGWYKEAGLEVEILGYSKAGVVNVLENRGADFGMSYATELAIANSAGAHLKIVYNLQQKSSVGVAVRKDSNINSPKDLDGKVYAAYDAGENTANIKEMIKKAGGKGDFKTIIMNTGAYEAVADKKADFAEGFTTWEGVEFEIRNVPFRFFYPADYGVPTSPCVPGIAANNEIIKKNPEIVKKFVQATMKGYNYTVAHPQEAAKILLQENPQAKLKPELVFKSQAQLSAKYWTDDRGGTGFANLKLWQQYLDHLTKMGTIKDANGHPLTTPPNANTMVTNEFVQ